jgi:sec-independent protein translocase protein TatA
MFQGLGLPHLLILALVVLVLFGRGRISEMMGDFGKGIKSFKQGINEDAADSKAAPPPPQIPPQPSAEKPVESERTGSGDINS